MGTKNALAQEKVIVITDETRNREGYLDMVPYLAIKDMIKKERKKRQKTFGFRPVVYICSPYSGDVEANTKKARRYSRFAVDKGMIPLAPHLLLPQYMNEDSERDLALFMGSIFLDKCVELWVFGDTISNGMACEIKRARLKDKTIRHFDDSLNETKGIDTTVRQEASI